VRDWRIIKTDCFWPLSAYSEYSEYKRFSEYRGHKESLFY